MRWTNTGRMYSYSTSGTAAPYFPNMMYFIDITYKFVYGTASEFREMVKLANTANFTLLGQIKKFVQTPKNNWIYEMLKAVPSNRFFLAVWQNDLTATVA